MGKKILTLGDIEIEKKITAIRLLFFLGMKIPRKYLYLTQFLLVKETVNTLLVTYTIIIKLSHYI